MNGTERIRTIAERNVELLRLKPQHGHLTAATRARIEDGLRCTIEDGPWRLEADLPEKAGGADSAPTPGALGRGALASCLAMMITSWAARLGIPLDSVEVEVQTDFDARGQLGVGDVPTGYQAVRHIVSIESPASAATIRELVEIAERHSPYVDVFALPQRMHRTVRLNGTEV